METPDTLTMSFAPDTSTLTQDGGFVQSVVGAGTGRWDITFVSGFFTSPPEFSGYGTQITDTSGPLNCRIENGLTSTTGARIACFTSAGALNSDIQKLDVTFTKTGADAKQKVQVYKSVPKASQNLNEYSAVFDGNGGCTKLRESIPGGVTCTRNSAGDYTLDYTALGLTEAPSINCTTGDLGGVRGFCHTQAVAGFTATQASVRTKRGDNASASDNQLNIIIKKQGADYKLPIVQPILVGQVQNSFAQTGTVLQYRTEMCIVSLSGGTPQQGSALCDNWIDSYTDTAVGRATLNFKAGIFTGTPACVAMISSSGSRGTTYSGLTSAGITVNLWDGNNNPVDNSFSILCEGR